MKPNNFIYLLLIFICGQCPGQSDFRYSRKIGSVTKEGWYALSLPSEIFKDLDNDFSDLRVYSVRDNDTLELPYLIDVRTDKVTYEKVDLSLFNKSSRNGVLFLTFELSLSQNVNSIDLEFQESNYFALVTLEGSMDRNDWFEVTKDQRIVSIQNASGNYRLSTVGFPLSEYRFLRVRVKGDTPMTFKRASFQYNKVKSGAYHSLPLNWSVETDKKTKETFVNITLHDYVPVSAVSLRTDNKEDYYRSFRLEYVRDSSRIEKRWIKYYQTAYEGNLTSFTENDFKFREVPAKKMRLVIRDRDNQPLSIRSVSAEGPDVKVLSYLKPGKNFLFYGGAGVALPSYDLAYFENKIPDSAMVATLEPEVTILVEEDHDSPLFQNKAWLWSIMGLMIGGLGFYTMKMIKSKA